VYYDKSSIKKESENIISVLNKDVLSEKAKKKYFSLLKEIHKAPKNPSMLNYYIKLMEIDCLNKKIKDISVIIYNEKGKVIYSSPKSESGEWNDILPDTVGEKLIKIVSCETVTPAVTPNKAVVAPKVEEPVTPVANAKAATAVPVPNAAPDEKAASAAVPVETAIPVVTAEPVPAAAPVETAAPAVTAQPAPTVAPVETAAPVATPPPVETVAPNAPEPAVTDQNLAQVDNKQIDTKSASEEAVRNLLTKWLNSWKSGDMKTYRSCYESNFKSEVTYTNASVSYKTNVRQKSKKINISVDKLQISADENTATAVFTQYYNSSILKYSGKKKLKLRKTNDEWKIYREIM